MNPNQAIEVRTVDGAFFDLLRMGKYGWKRHYYRNMLYSKQVLAGIDSTIRILFIRDSIGRWFPSFRKFILWHEYQHFRIRRAYGYGFKAFIITFAHDISGVAIYPAWYFAHPWETKRTQEHDADSLPRWLWHSFMGHSPYFPRPKSFGPSSHAKLGHDNVNQHSADVHAKATIGVKGKDLSRNGKQPSHAAPPENRELSMAAPDNPSK